MTCVLDASVAASWAFSDETGGLGAALLNHLPQSTMLTPAIWPFEIRNILLKPVS